MTTVGELKKWLEQFDDNAIIQTGQVISGDRYKEFQISNRGPSYSYLNVQMTATEMIFYGSKECEKCKSTSGYPKYIPSPMKNVKAEDRNSYREDCCAGCDGCKMKTIKHTYPNGKPKGWE